MVVKLIAIDLDGTLLDHHHNVTDTVKHSISAAKEQGVHIVIATGRPFMGAQRYIKELGLDQPGNYCISNNGGLVQHAHSGEHLSETLLSFDDYLLFEGLSRELGCHFHALDFTTLYTANRDISPYTVQESFLSRIPLVYCPADEMNRNLQFPKLMFIDHPEILDRVISRIPAEIQQNYTLMKSSGYFLEILNKKADKGAGVKIVAEHLGISREQIMCIGDHSNDLAMINYAGIGVAMGNAQPSIKQAAQFITLSNQENGVAVAIDKFVLNQ